MENNGVIEREAGQTARLREAFQRCCPGTMEAILRFRRDRDLASGLASMHGIIQRYTKTDNGQPVSAMPAATRLREDLGIDSLSLLEIVMAIEDALGLQLQANDLSKIRTLGEMRQCVDDFIHGRPSTLTGPEVYDRDRLWLLLPQQPPFLFLDRAEIQGEDVRASYRFRKDECFLPDRSHGDPLVPASILYEALGQAGCLWVLEHVPSRLQRDVTADQIAITGFEEARSFRLASPGEEIEITLRLTQLHAPHAIFQGEVKSQGEALATVKGLTITFETPGPSGERAVQPTGKQNGHHPVVEE